MPTPLKAFLPVAAALILVLHLSCAPGENVAGGAGAGNPGRPTALVCKAASDLLAPEQPVMTDSAGTVFTIASASLHFEYISFIYPEDAPVPAGMFPFEPPLAFADSTVVMQTPVCFDLLAGNPSPDPGELLLPRGTYDRIKVKIAAHSDTAAALRITGTFGYDGRTDRQYTIELTFNNTAVFFSDPGIILEQGMEPFGLLIRLNTDLWLHNLDITALLDEETLELDDDGNLRINQSREHRYPALETAIRTNIVQSGKLQKND